VPLPLLLLLLPPPPQLLPQRVRQQLV